jgi:hypothetical protein
MKRLGAAACVGLTLLAISVLMASGASAAEFECEVPNCVYTSEQHAAPNAFSLSVGTGLSVTCTSVKTESYSATAKATELTVTPTYSGCTSSVGSATINVNHCDFDFTAGPTSNGDAPIHLTCSGGTLLEITTGGCTVKFGAQTPSGGVHYINVEAVGKKHMTWEYTVNQLAYTKAGLTCGFVSGEAKIRGAFTVKCYGSGTKAETATTTFTYSHNNSQSDCKYIA